jgi:hypothetical protein
MVNTSNDKSVPKLYASSKELEALKHKLDSFIQEQDAHNKTITSSLEKLLKLAEDSGAKLPDTTPEDKGSSVKGKGTNPSYKIPQLIGGQSLLEEIQMLRRKSVLFQSLATLLTNNSYLSKVNTNLTHKMANLRMMNTLTMMMVMSILSNHGIFPSKMTHTTTNCIAHHHQTSNQTLPQYHQTLHRTYITIHIPRLSITITPIPVL